MLGLAGVFMYVKMWEADSFFDMSFNSYLKDFMDINLDGVETCFFYKVSTDNLMDFIVKSNRFMTHNGRVILVSSNRCLPLSALFLQVMDNVYIMFRGVLYGRNSDLSKIIPDEIKIITQKELYALKLSFSNLKEVSFENLNRKTFYSQRYSALNKLGFKSISEVFLC